MCGKDYYELLGVSRLASDEEVRKAFRRCALSMHPDKNTLNKNEAGERFKDISEAFSVLSNSEKRREYDMAHAPGRRDQDSRNTTVHAILQRRSCTNS